MQYLTIQNYRISLLNINSAHYTYSLFGQTISSIHEIYFDTLVYTPGASLSPQNFPNDVIPTCVNIPKYSAFFIWSGPPESP